MPEWAPKERHVALKSRRPASCLPGLAGHCHKTSPLHLDRVGVECDPIALTTLKPCNDTPGGLVRLGMIEAKMRPPALSAIQGSSAKKAA